MGNEIKRSRCIIICASPECKICGLKPDDYIIACDGGYAHAAKHGIRPDLTVGDFDSYKGELAPDIRTLRAPAEKDDTDTMLAIKLALSAGYRDFVLCGAMGGRLDHELANVAAAAYIAMHGGRCSAIYEGGAMHVLKDGTLRLEGLKGQTVSILSYSEVSTGVTLEGMKYPLHDGTLTNSFPIGVSNVAEADVCSVCVKQGILLVFEAGWN